MPQSRSFPLTPVEYAGLAEPRLLAGWELHHDTGSELAYLFGEGSLYLLLLAYDGTAITYTTGVEPPEPVLDRVETFYS